MELPKREHVFNFDYKDVLGKRHEGSFTCKVNLNIQDKHAVELERTRLQGNYANPTDTLAGIARILANLRVRIIIKDAPPWYQQSEGGALLDEDVLVALFDKVDEGDRLWRESLTKQAEVAIKEQPKS
jgi:hypothetical protein